MAGWCIIMINKRHNIIRALRLEVSFVYCEVIGTSVSVCNKSYE